MTALALFLVIAAIIIAISVYAILLAFWLALELVMWVVNPLRGKW